MDLEEEERSGLEVVRQVRGIVKNLLPMHCLQATGETEADLSSANSVDSDRPDGEVRCIKKVMQVGSPGSVRSEAFQVEKTVFDEKIRCEHRFTEKCHNTYITDYTPVQVE